MLPKNRPPTPPGEILREEFLVPFDLTQAALADRLGVTTESVNRLVNGKRAVSVAMALRLSRVLGTTPDFWLNLQRAHDLWHKRRELDAELRTLEKIKRAG